MRNSLLALSLAFTAPIALAQNCLDGDLGQLIGVNTTDAVLPMQAIGFPFPIGGTTYTHLHITDHGFVQLSNAGVPAPSTTQFLYTPTLANFPSNAPMVCALWADIVGSNGGLIYLNRLPTKCTVTWLNMQNFQVAAPRFDFQMTLFPNGDVKCVYGPGCTNNSGFGGAATAGIVGITPGFNAALPSASDLSVAGSTTNATVFELFATPNSFDLGNNTLVLTATGPGYSFATLGAQGNCAAVRDFGTGCGVFGLLSMTHYGRPSLGNPNFELRITNVPVLSPLVLLGIGDTVVDPGTPLDSIGMPGCFAYTNLNVGLLNLGPPVSNGATFSLAVPSLPALAGTVWSVQAIGMTLLNPLGLFSSNGVEMHFGF